MGLLAYINCLKMQESNWFRKQKRNAYKSAEAFYKAYTEDVFKSLQPRVTGECACFQQHLARTKKASCVFFAPYLPGSEFRITSSLSSD